MTAADLADRARRYYDANTHRFLRFGQGGYAGAIHRSVWGPSVQSEREAFEYADRFVLERLTRLAESSSRAEPPASTGRALHVLDLGCGVGASLAYLAARLPMRGTGITISPVQAQLARERLAQSEVGARIRILEGSYLDIPKDVGVADAAFSIEAFLHCPDPDRYFAEAAAHIPPGGLLMILDDFITERASGPLAAKEARLLREFQEGWVTASLKTPAAVEACAKRHGFALTENADFTPHLELRRPRDRLIAGFVAVARHLPVRTEYFKNFLGGNALNQGLTSRLLEYRFLVFEKRA